MLFNQKMLFRIVELLEPLLLKDKIYDLSVILSEDLYLIILDLAPRSDPKKADRDLINNILSAIEQQKKIELKIAFEPTQAQVASILDYLKQATKNVDYKVNISVDANILAGAIIECGGRVYDYSYSDKF